MEQALSHKSLEAFETSTETRALSSQKCIFTPGFFRALGPLKTIHWPLTNLWTPRVFKKKNLSCTHVGLKCQENFVVGLGVGDMFTPSSERRPERFYYCSLHWTWVLPSSMATPGRAPLALPIGSCWSHRAASRRAILDLCLASRWRFHHFPHHPEPQYLSPHESSTSVLKPNNHKERIAKTKTKTPKNKNLGPHLLQS